MAPRDIKLSRPVILGIGIVCGLLAAAFQGWWLYQWLGWSIWFFMVVVPACLVSLQVVAGTVAIALHKQFGDPSEKLLPDLQPPQGPPEGP